MDWPYRGLPSNARRPTGLEALPEPKGRASSPLRADGCNHASYSAKDGAPGVTRPTSAKRFMAGRIVTFPMNRRICRQVLDCCDGVREVTALALPTLFEWVGKAPNPKLQRSSKSQIPEASHAARTACHRRTLVQHEGRSFWSLVLAASLGFRAWDLELCKIPKPTVDTAAPPKAATPKTPSPQSKTLARQLAPHSVHGPNACAKAKGGFPMNAHNGAHFLCL
jgi:hypothetical protein